MALDGILSHHMAPGGYLVHPYQVALVMFAYLVTVFSPVHKLWTTPLLLLSHIFTKYLFFLVTSTCLELGVPAMSVAVFCSPHHSYLCLSYFSVALVRLYDQSNKKEFIWGLQFQRFRVHNSGAKSWWQIHLRAHIMISKWDELGTKYSNEWTYKGHSHSAPHYICIVLFPVPITLEVWVFTQFIGRATLNRSCVNYSLCSLYKYNNN